MRTPNSSATGAHGALACPSVEEDDLEDGEGLDLVDSRGDSPLERRYSRISDSVFEWLYRPNDASSDAWWRVSA